MKRIDTPNRAVDLFGAGKDGFRKAVAGASSATEFSDLWFNHIQEAIIRIIEAAGLTLSDTDFDQFKTALDTLYAKVGGITTVTLAGSNVTLSAVQVANPLIVLTGTLTADVNVIFPNTVGHWTVLDNCGGTFTVTCKTAAGLGVAMQGQRTAELTGDGTNIYGASLFVPPAVVAGGTADALTVAWPNSNIPGLAKLDGVPFWVRATAANGTTTPTVQINAQGAIVAVKGAGAALAVGDIAGAGHWLCFQYDKTLSKMVLLNPAKGVTAAAASLPVAGGAMAGDIAMGNNRITALKNVTFNGQGSQAGTTGALTIDWTAAQNYLQAEPTGAITYTFTAPAGPCHLQLLIASDGTSTAQTITWPATVKWLGATWAAAANKGACINFWYDGASYWAIGSNQV